MYTRPGRQVARFSLGSDRTLVLFVFRADAAPGQPPSDLEGRKSFLNRVYANAGWECPDILLALNTVDDLYFDTVSQIQIPAWSQGRVVLIGNAAAWVFCWLVRGPGSR
jgi:2-polyprenyl-6-methoxyphenol hydroxylase-like FAD-dependent oxidoreductase